MKLKPCPFCGGNAAISSFEGLAFVFCVKCKAKTEIVRNNEKDIIELWNARIYENEQAENKNDES